MIAIINEPLDPGVRCMETMNTRTFSVKYWLQANSCKYGDDAHI